MRVLFVSNDLTHHLVPFFTSLSTFVGEKNCVFAVKEVDSYRASMGFPLYSEPWVFKVYEKKDQEYKELWKLADVIICRCWDEVEQMKEALNRGKLVFYASERWFKPPIGICRLLFPSYLKRYISFKELSDNPNFYYLAMGYYANYDFNRIDLCEKRRYNFGYFTPNCSCSSDNTADNQIKILWAGRMLGWKRVEDILKVYKRIEKTYNVSLTIVGDGPQRSKLEKYISKHKLSSVSLLKFIKNDELKALMLGSDIYVLPSNGYEGWGAVINEAMQCRCAVIATEEAGAAKSMILDGENGLLYRSGNLNELEKKIVSLLEDKVLLARLKDKGYDTINTLWSADEAAKRFYHVADSLMDNHQVNHYTSGPMLLLG